MGDITKEQVDAIANAANKFLLGGGGVDGAIHAAAGTLLLEECRALGGCETGQAKITKSYNLPAKYVIHTVGPIYGQLKGQAAKFLADCYQNSLKLAKEKLLRTVAFPAISTGVYGFPKKEAAKIAINTVKKFIEDNPEVFQEIVFVLFNQENYQIYDDFLFSP